MSMTLSIDRLTDGRRMIHLTDGEGESCQLTVGEALFQEMRKVFDSDAVMVEVGWFTEYQCKVFVDEEGKASPSLPLADLMDREIDRGIEWLREEIEERRGHGREKGTV
jgi:hypothetical protein